MADLSPPPTETGGSEIITVPGSDTQSERYRYTTGGDENLIHTRVLGSGGFGTVHEVATS